MDKQFLSLLIGTIVRGLIWGAATLCGWLGVTPPPDSTWEPVAEMLAAVALAGVAMFWSMVKNQKLIEQPPPPPAGPDD